MGFDYSVIGEFDKCNFLFILLVNVTTKVFLGDMGYSPGSNFTISKVVRYYINNY